jgi:hypothetical protein
MRVDVSTIFIQSFDYPNLRNGIYIDNIPVTVS